MMAFVMFMCPNKATEGQGILDFVPVKQHSVLRAWTHLIRTVFLLSGCSFFTLCARSILMMDPEMFRVYFIIFHSPNLKLKKSCTNHVI